MLDEKIENVSCSFESSNIAQRSNILFVGWFLCNVQKKKKKKRKCTTRWKFRLKKRSGSAWNYTVHSLSCRYIRIGIRARRVNVPLRLRRPCGDLVAIIILIRVPRWSVRRMFYRSWHTNLFDISSAVYLMLMRLPRRCSFLLAWFLFVYWLLLTILTWSWFLELRPRYGSRVIVSCIILCVYIFRDQITTKVWTRQPELNECPIFFVNGN